MLMQRQRTAILSAEANRYILVLHLNEYIYFFALASYQRRHLMLTAGRLFFYYRCLFHSFIHNLPTSGWMAVDSHSDFHMNDLNDCI